MKSIRKQKINILLTAVVICISIVAVGVVYVPKFMKMDMFVVETGSMSPTIKANSLIYVKSYKNFEDYNVGDIVTFTDPVQKKSFTHRIVGIDDPEFSVHNAQALRIPEFSEISFALFRNSADFRGFGRRIGRVDRKQTFARGVKQFIARFFALGERFHVFHAGDDFPRDGVDG